MREYKILFPIYSFINSGGFRVITKLANEWSLMGHCVDILVMNDSTPYYPFEEKVRIIRKSHRNKLMKMKTAVDYIVRYGKQYDAVIGTFYLTCLPMFFAGLIRRNFDNYYYYIQAYEPEFDMYGGSKFQKKLAEFTYKMPFKKIVNSQLYFNYKALKTERFCPPGLDLKLYCPKELKYFSPVIKIGTIGRTEEWKGTSDVCKAMEILKSDGIQFEFYIAFNDFETIPHHFVKPDGDEKLSAFYRDMDIVVAACKGQYGAIHYPVIETMAVGSSIVCTDYYPSNDSNAYKVDGGAPEQIALAIKHITDNKGEAVKRRMRALQDVQQFDWSLVAQKFLRYIEEDNK